MAAIIDNQQIARRRNSRRRSSSGFASGTRSTNKSAGFNSGFMSQFNQKPAHVKKKKPRKISSIFKIIPDIKKLRKRKLSAGCKKAKKEKKSSGFSFPAPSLPTLAVIAGTVVIALAAFNWENISIEIPSIYAFQPVINSDAEQYTMNYALTGISSIIEGNNKEFKASNPVNPEQTENDNPHGMLIAFEWQQYKVLRGDSVSVIAQKFGVSMGAIISSNEIKNARLLQEGTTLRIPNIDGIPYQVQSGDSLSRISASFNVPLEVILDANDIKSDNIRSGETLFIPGARMNDIDLRLSLGELFMYPLQSRYITSNYGWRRDPFNGRIQFHDGVDFRANTRTTVMASMDGVVSVVSENWLYGKYIIISHSNGYKTLYGHLNSFAVKEGDKVARGRKIGETGNTGYSTGPHLHFGMYDKNNKLVNPLELLN